MKTMIRVTGGGLFGADGEIPVGSEWTIRGDVPAAWSGKVQVIGQVPDDAEIVAADDQTGGDAQSDDVDHLRAQLAALGAKVDMRWGAERLQAEIDAAGKAD